MLTSNSPDCTMVTSSYFYINASLANSLETSFSDAFAASAFLSTATLVMMDPATTVDTRYTYVTTSDIVSFNPSLIIDTTFSYNPCSPIQSIPAKVFSINLLWDYGAPGLAGSFDPPHVLTAGESISVITLADPVQQVTTVSAAAGSIPDLKCYFRILHSSLSGQQTSIIDIDLSTGLIIHIHFLVPLRRPLRPSLR